jgi:hypothetical protein
MAQTQTTFTPEQLKVLIDSTAGWATCWDDTIFYLRVFSESDTHLPKDVCDAVYHAALRAKQHDVPFTTDYRVLWEATTGQPAEGLPAPELRYAPANPIELEKVYLRDMPFPNDRGFAYAYAEDRGAPWRVLQTIHQLPRHEFKSMKQILDEIGDIAWNPHA